VTRNKLNEIVPAKQNRRDKRHAGGMTIFEPTDEQLESLKGRPDLVCLMTRFAN